MQERSAASGESLIEPNFLVPGGGPFTAPKSPLPFKLVRHGYDRDQVDERLADLLNELSTERQNRMTIENQLAKAEAQGGLSFGGRLEKMLRMADREAAELRAAATEEAAGILAEARIKTAAHEREVAKFHASQQADAARQAEQLRTARSSHQAAMSAEIEAARQAASGIRANAEGEAERVVEQANADAREIRSAARQAATEQHDEIRSEIGRLIGTRNRVCAEVSRLQEVLAQAIGSVRHDAASGSSLVSTSGAAVDGSESERNGIMLAAYSYDIDRAPGT